MRQPYLETFKYLHGKLQDTFHCNYEELYLHQLYLGMQIEELFILTFEFQNLNAREYLTP